jgi:predicted transposase/invertase (TIGR01784 family)
LGKLYSIENIVAAFFNLFIASDTKKILKAEAILSNLVKNNEELWEIILEWLTHFFISKDINISNITLKGGEQMLSAVIDNIRKESWIEGMEKGKLEGMEKGKLERNVEIAKNLLKINLPEEQIARITDMSVEEIQKIIM